MARTPPEFELGDFELVSPESNNGVLWGHLFDRITYMTPDQATIDAAKTIDVLVEEWQRTSEYLTQCKEREMYLRKLIADRMFHDKKTNAGFLPEGTTTVGYAGSTHNYGAKAQLPYKREVDESTYEAAVKEAQLTAEEYQACFSIDVKLKVAGYKALPAEKRTILDKCIVVKPGSLALEVNTLPK